MYFMFCFVFYQCYVDLKESYSAIHLQLIMIDYLDSNAEYGV